MRQERFLIVTNERLLNVKKKEFQRSIAVNTFRGCTRSNTIKNKEFVVHVSNEYDYRFICEEIDELFIALRYVFSELVGRNLPIYSVDSALKTWETGKKDARAGKFKTPPKECRIWDEDEEEDCGDTGDGFLGADGVIPNGGNYRASFARNNDMKAKLADF